MGEAPVSTAFGRAPDQFDFGVQDLDAAVAM
jgi:hypothetical protein